MLFRLHVPLLHGNLGNGTEKLIWLTADICFLCSPCLSFTYNLPFFSHSKYQYLDVFFFLYSLLLFLFHFLSVGSVSKLAVYIGRRAGAKKYGQQLPRSAGFEGTDCTFFIFPLPPRCSPNGVTTQLRDLIHIQTSKSHKDSSVTFYYGVLIYVWS